MSVHLANALKELKHTVLLLGTQVEDSVRLAASAVEQNSAELAQRVFRNDMDVIDPMEARVEEECLKMLALYQPVAADLRFIVSVLKISNDLERIGDIAVSIAERAVFLASAKPVRGKAEFPKVAAKTQRMLKQSLSALVNIDAELAKNVIKSETELESLNREIHAELQDAIRSTPHDVEALLSLLFLYRSLEGIKELAVSIAQDVVYLVSAEVVRHRTPDGSQDTPG